MPGASLVLFDGSMTMVPAEFKLELWVPRPRGARPYVARFYYRNAAGVIVAVDSCRRAYDGAKHLVAEAHAQLAEDLRDGDHLVAIEFANWLDAPRDGVPRVNPPRHRPLVKLSKRMRAVLMILDSAPEDWVPFAELCALLDADTVSRRTSLRTTVQGLSTGHSRRMPLVETTYDDDGRLLVRSTSIPEQ